jgi:hypothetical protein
MLARKAFYLKMIEIRNKTEEKEAALSIKRKATDRSISSSNI